jgi:hypothetical protein
MGPVSWQELTELAEAGILKPHDMVWAEGMDNWIKAINQKGLFAKSDDDEAEKVTVSKKSAYTTPKPPPGRRTSRTDDEDDEDEDEEDEKEARKKARKREDDRARTGVGIKVGLILAGVLVILLLLVCGGGTLIAISFWPTKDGGGQVKDGVRRESFTVNNLGEKRAEVRVYTFTQGKRVTITSTNNLQNQNTDVDLRVFNGGGGLPNANERPFVWDDRLPQEDKNCRLTFDVQRTGQYRILVVNLGPGRANSCVVNIEER